MKIWRYKHLKAAHIFESRMTLKRAVDEGRFAPGRMITPNVRGWTDAEVEALLENSPSARKTGARSSDRAE
jgi:hypothetical protein